MIAVVRTHRPARTSWRATATILLLCGGLAARPAWGKLEPNPPAVPHPVAGFSDCLKCHDPKGGIHPAPADHGRRTSDSCPLCHLEGYTPASACGTGTGADADLAVASAGCRSCHTSEEFHIVADFKCRSDVVKELEARRMYAHRFIACVTCHPGDPHGTLNRVTKESIADACGRCHREQRALHQHSVHGRSLKSGSKDAATCIDCHSTEGTPHSIARVLSPGSPAFRGRIAQTCARCHARLKMMERHGVTQAVYKTYMGTFHGKANVLSPYEITQHPKATCINCHGYHDIKPVNDPASPVSPANLPHTCGGCHQGAGKKFAAAWMGHQEATPQEYPTVYFAERFFFWLTTSVLTFGFIGMVGLDVAAWLWRRRRPEEAAS